MSQLHLTQPLVFEPIFMERVWGGRRLESLYRKPLPQGVRIGESWEIVDRAEAQSVVHLGPLRGRTLHELWTEHRREVFGNAPDSPRFPILAKLLDAQENLSLQVHPPAQIAAQLNGEPKSETWYVADAAPGAQVFAGLRKGSSRAAFEKASQSEEVEQHLHAIAVSAGDAIFLPSGRLHALGAGNVIVEIQQNSDTTYRVYDWDRVKKGEAARTMHLEEALQCIDFADVEPTLLKQDGETLVRQEFFDVEKWSLDGAREIAPPGRFAIVVCLTGALECAGMELKPGDFFLLPAELPERAVKPMGSDVSLLRVTLPR
ncbi:MAG: mannose-6-phosphate isomerase [Verrucomicrobiota bacterium]|jgi:mannose-6-phosphate isomerase